MLNKKKKRKKLLMTIISNSKILLKKQRIFKIELADTQLLNFRTYISQKDMKKQKNPPI